MILAIDIGNTRTKGAVFEGNATRHTFASAPSDFEKKVSQAFLEYPEITTLVVSSVGKPGLDGLKSVPSRVKVHIIDRDSRFPFINTYETPDTLGIDRMVLASGAVLQFPTQNRLVIDAGTCITYDYIDSENRYLGGAISPGIRLRYESMHRYTAKLPLLERENASAQIGKTTAQAMHSGVVNGVIHEIEGFINSWATDPSNFIIILTGGDSEFLAGRLKNTIFANPNFLLESLNQTFQFSLDD